MCFLSSGSLPTYQQPYTAYQHPSWARDTCGNTQSCGASPNPGSGRNRNFDPLACDGRLCPYWARTKLLLPLSTIMTEILISYKRFQSHSKFYSVFPKKVQPQLWQVSCHARWQIASWLLPKRLLSTCNNQGFLFIVVQTSQAHLSLSPQHQ